MARRIGVGPMTARRRKSRFPWALLVLLALAGLGAWYFLVGPGSADQASPADEPNAPTDGRVASFDANAADPNRPGPPRPDITRAQAADALHEARAARARNDLLAERELLNAAYWSGHLPPAQADELTPRLGYLAEMTALADVVYDEDPYCYEYLVQPGDVLSRIEVREDLNVPPQLLVRVNGLRSAAALRAGKPIKLIRGPFHAVVDKRDFTMDIYLQRDDLPKVFIRRLRVGLGRNDRTPVGLWRVDPTKKLRQADWNPPLVAGVDQRIIRWGDPDYPLGKMGYWIGLEGIEEKTRFKHGFGIHGTNEPESIGRAASLGCIRLSDADIEFVYATLYPKHSTVLIVE